MTKLRSKPMILPAVAVAFAIAALPASAQYVYYTNSYPAVTTYTSSYPAVVNYGYRGYNNYGYTYPRSYYGSRYPYYGGGGLVGGVLNAGTGLVGGVLRGLFGGY